MNTKYFPIVCTALALIGATEVLGAKRPFNLDDITRQESVGGNFHMSPDGYEETVLLSPDGKTVFFSLSAADWDVNQRVWKYYTISSSGGDATRVLAVDGGQAFQYSPRGTYLSFVKLVDERDQVFVLDVATGDVAQISNHATDVFDYKWSADESAVYFIADDSRTAEEQARYELGADWFAVDDGSNGRIAARWRNLWKLDLDAGAESQITAEKLILDELDVSPDGKRVVFVARPDNRRNYPHTAELYAVDISDKALIRLTENLAPESMPRWSPDGMKIAYYAPDDQTYKLTKGYLWVLNIDTGDTTKLESQNMGDIYTLTWSTDNESLFFSEQQRMNTNIFRLHIESDSIYPITNTDGFTKLMALSADQSRMVYSYSNFNSPVEVYSSPVSRLSPVRLTQTNEWMDSEIELAESTVIRWKSNDGLDIEGMLAVPDGYDGEVRLPLLVLIHGGPPQQWANEFYREVHLYTGLGYAILGANVRGSSGYGNNLIQALIGDVGGGEYEDIMSGVDHVIEMGIADPERLALRGWSWGGVLGSWVITQTDRFKAASVGAGVMSWLSEMGPGFNWDLTEWYMENSHWEDPESWRKVSSITYVENVTTPTLIFHGDEDWYSSYNQSLIFYTGLRDIGKAPVRFISFPGRGHEELDPWAQRARYVEEVRWMQKFVNGIDWQPSSEN